MEENESVIKSFSRSRLKASNTFRRQPPPLLQGLTYKLLAFVVIIASTTVANGVTTNDQFMINDNDSDYVYDTTDTFKRIYQNLTINTPINKTVQHFMSDARDSGDNNVTMVNISNITTAISTTSNQTEAAASSTIDIESTMVNDQNNYWALSALILVLGTAAGNILVCLAIAWERRLQNVTNYFLMSLAITDLMVAILVMPLGILTLFKGEFILLFYFLFFVSKLYFRIIK